MTPRWFGRFHLHSLIYEVTPRCNQRCAHCYNVWKGDPSYGQQELSTSRACALIARAIHQSRCRQMTFTGGEPTLRPDLEILVAEAARRCPHIALITNGTLLDGERVASLVEAGVTLFELPLNSGDSATHDRMAGLPGAFDLVLQAAVEIRAHGGELTFVFVATNDTIQAWPQVLDLGLALGARSFLFNRYNAGGTCGSHPDPLMPPLEHLRWALEIAEDRAVRHRISISAGVPIQPCLLDTRTYPHIGFGYCAAGTDHSYTTLDPMGHVRPCNHSALRLGNLFESNLKTMLHSQAMRAFQNACPEVCAGCALERHCQGGCKAAAEVCHGDPRLPEPFLKRHLEVAQPIRDAATVGRKS